MKLSRNTKCATVVAALAMAATTGIGAVVSNTTNVDAATVAHVTDGASLYKADGKIITNRALAPNSDWLVGKITTINGETMYQVSTNEYLRARDSSLSGQSNQAQPTKLVGTVTSQLSLYRDDTNSMSNRALGNGSAWQVGKLVVNKLGQEFAQVSTHEYADASKLQFNMAKPSPTYIADFGITKTSSDNNENTNTNNSGSTDTNTNTNTGTDTSTDTNTGSTTTDNNSGSTTTNPSTGTDTGSHNTTSATPDVAGIKAAVIASINAERQSRGLSSLTEDPRIDTIAAKRAQEISNNFSHTRPDGNNVYTELKSVTGFSGQGENISGDVWNQLSEQSSDRLAKVIMDNFKGEGESSTWNHYMAIINPNAKYLGVGVYVGSDGEVYTVQDYAG